MPEQLELKRTKQVISPREIFFRYIHYLPWVAISVALTLMGAYLKLRYSTNIYSVSGRLLVTTSNPYGSGSEKFDDIFMTQRGDKINDEIEIIKSRAIATWVVKSLGLQLQVYNKGKIRSAVVHLRDVPF